MALSLSAPAAFLRFAPSLTDIAKKDREEDEPVSGADQDDAQVHAEVEDLEDLRLGEGQHHDPSELGQGDAGEHLSRKKKIKMRRMNATKLEKRC